MEASTCVTTERAVVILVEDEDDVRNLVTYNLRAADLEVIGVGSLAAAIDEIERRRPAVVVIDRLLPDGDGIELCTRIRAEARPRRRMTTKRGARDAAQRGPRGPARDR